MRSFCLTMFLATLIALASALAQPAGSGPSKSATTASSPAGISFKDVTDDMGITNFQRIAKPEWPTCPEDDEHHYFHWPFNLCVGDLLGDGGVALFYGQHGEPVNGFSHLLALDAKTGKFNIYRGDKIAKPLARTRGAYLAGVVDANDDGLLDIVLSDGDTTGSILINHSKDGKPEFEKMPFLSPSGFAFADLGKTGGLDTVVSSADTLAVYRGVNTDKKNRVDTGIQVFGHTHGMVIIADFNNDGYDDILYTELALLAKTTKKDRLRLFLNQGDMKFKDVTAEAGLGKSCGGQIAVGDINNDGNLDIIAMGAENSDSPDGFYKVYLGDGEGHFTDATAKSGIRLPFPPRRKWSWEYDVRFNMLLADLDNDGLQELVTTADYGYFRNLGDGTFENFKLLRANGPGNGIVCAADFHNTGRLDLALLTNDPTPVRITQNLTDNPNKYLKLQLRQKDKNVFALGAKVYVYKPGRMGDAKGQIAMRELMSNEMNLVEFSTLHIGVGPNDKVDLRVVFPSGKVVEKPGLQTNQTVKILDSDATKTIEFKVKPFKA